MPGFCKTYQHRIIYQTLVTSISFLNAHHSNFLTAFFLRSQRQNYKYESFLCGIDVNTFWLPIIYLFIKCLFASLLRFHLLFSLMKKVTKKSRLPKKSWKFEWLSKMKSVTTVVQSRAFVGLTNVLLLPNIGNIDFIS